MKKLTLYGESLSVANEGFISDVADYLSGSMYGLMSVKNAERVIEEALKPKDFSAKKKNLEAILNQSVFNATWREKAVKKKTSKHTSKFAYIDGKPQPDPVKLAVCASVSMLKGAHEALEKLKGNTALRLELIKQLNAVKTAEEADEIYVKNKSKLTNNAPAVYVKAGGKTHSCVAASAFVKWPLQTYEDSKAINFCDYLRNKEAQELQAPTPESLATWGKAALQLVDTWKQAHEAYEKNYIPYWESCPHDYNELSHGDEIYDEIYTGQEAYQFSPMHELTRVCHSLIKDLLVAILVK